MTTAQKIENLTEKAVALGGDDMRYLLDQLAELNRTDGAEDLLIDLRDAQVIGPEAIEFAADNNGVRIPRR
jgi:hypothetical protein